MRAVTIPHPLPRVVRPPSCPPPSSRPPSARARRRRLPRRRPPPRRRRPSRRSPRAPSSTRFRTARTIDGANLVAGFRRLGLERLGLGQQAREALARPLDRHALDLPDGRRAELSSQGRRRDVLDHGAGRLQGRPLQSRRPTPDRMARRGAAPDGARQASRRKVLAARDRRLHGASSIPQRPGLHVLLRPGRLLPLVPVPVDPDGSRLGLRLRLRLDRPLRARHVDGARLAPSHRRLDARRRSCGSPAGSSGSRSTSRPRSAASTRRRDSSTSSRPAPATNPYDLHEYRGRILYSDQSGQIGFLDPAGAEPTTATLTPTDQTPYIASIYKTASVASTLTSDGHPVDHADLGSRLGHAGCRRAASSRPRTAPPIWGLAVDESAPASTSGRPAASALSRRRRPSRRTSSTCPSPRREPEARHDDADRHVEPRHARHDGRDQHAEPGRAAPARRLDRRLGARGAAGGRRRQAPRPVRRRRDGHEGAGRSRLRPHRLGPRRGHVHLVAVSVPVRGRRLPRLRDERGPRDGGHRGRRLRLPLRARRPDASGRTRASSIVQDAKGTISIVDAAGQTRGTLRVRLALGLPRPGLHDLRRLRAAGAAVGANRLHGLDRQRAPLRDRLRPGERRRRAPRAVPLGRRRPLAHPARIRPRPRSHGHAPGLQSRDDPGPRERLLPCRAGRRNARGRGTADRKRDRARRRRRDRRPRRGRHRAGRARPLVGSERRGVRDVPPGPRERRDRGVRRRFAVARRGGCRRLARRIRLGDRERRVHVDPPARERRVRHVRRDRDLHGGGRHGRRGRADGHAPRAGRGQSSGRGPRDRRPTWGAWT